MTDVPSTWYFESSLRQAFHLNDNTLALGSFVFQSRCLVSIVQIQPDSDSRERVICAENVCLSVAPLMSFHARSWDSSTCDYIDR
jgi:hypothetical protein